MTFAARLDRSWSAAGSMLCVGLDPDPARMPLPLDGVHDATEQFCRAIVDAVADIACAIKPQVAFFSSQGEERALERICAYVCETYPDVTLILDAKRGDIGSTAEHYAREAFGRYGAHAVTVSPYLGTDSVAPYFEHGGAVFVLCRTSNPGGDELQSLVADGRPVYQHVAQRVADEWSQLGDCGLVVGATYPEELRIVRSIAPDTPLLVPGIGAQGGDPQVAVTAGADAAGRGLVVNSSRAVLYASSGRDFADAARAAAHAAAAQLPVSTT
ncbi:MAG: orotidine-5'-phosphate decarboxylase [Ilumatobacteraceae bacterium]|nr:orotidine-5'-phosphate decarboxylase [Ilumatobacteraceae bacterium]